MEEGVRALGEQELALPKDAGDRTYDRLVTESLEAHDRTLLGIGGEVGALLRRKRDSIDALRSSINSSLAAAGSDRQKAREQLSAGLAAVRSDLLLISEANSGVLKEQATYRLRASADQELLARRDLFHVPFERAAVIGSYRYSAARIPCLYVGVAVQLCWLETRRVERRTCYVARFELDFSRLQILDLSCSPLQLVKPFETVRVVRAATGDSLDPLRFSDMPQTDDFADYVAAFLAIWPLLLAISVRGREGDEAKRHYVIPQLLMEIVQQTKEYDGVRYFSTQYPRTIRSSQDIPLNYAFPAKVVADAGYCPHLKERLLCTEPLPLSVFVDNPSFGAPRSLADSEIRNQRRGWLSSVEGGEYQSTEFGRMEYVLDQLPVATIDTPGKRETTRRSAQPS